MSIVDEFEAVAAATTIEPNMDLTAMRDIPGLLREVMASVATPVSVVTAIDAGRPHGTTVSAFASLSMSPPMVLVALDEKSNLLSLLKRTGRFGLNILGAGQADLAMQFAKKGQEKFLGVSWAPDQCVPRLAGAGWLACTTTTIIPAGDHSIVVGLVIDGEASEGQPLTYHSRTFGTHVALESKQLREGTH